MVESVFSKLPEVFVRGLSSGDKSYYFSLGDVKKTVLITAEGCTVSDGRNVEKADCVCKTSPEFFLKIWDDGYRPGLKDFMSGTIKSNNPDALRDFLRNFGKDA